MTIEQTTATHLTLIEGGKDQKRSIPVELQPIFAAMTSHSQALQEAFQPIEQKVADMENDWDIRSLNFWEDTLNALKALKAKVRSACSLIDDVEISFSAIGFIHTRYELMVPLHHVASLIDNTGIALTAYLPHCQSRVESRLQQRRQIFRKLQEITGEMHIILSILGEKGQAQCLAEQERFLRESAAMKKRSKREKAPKQQAQDAE